MIGYSADFPINLYIRHGTYFENITIIQVALGLMTSAAAKYFSPTAAFSL